MGKILIGIDHKWRDLPGYVFLGEILKKLGHEVEYVRNGFEDIFIYGYKPDVVIVNHLYELKRQKLSKKWKEMGIKTVILPTEGIPTIKKYRAFAAGAQNDLSSVALYLFWNEPMKNEVIKNNKTIDPKRCKVVGVPRFDFYKEPLSKLLSDKNGFLKKHGFANCNYPVITFATNYTQAQFYEKNREFFKEDAKNLGFDKVFEDMGGLESIPKRDFESREVALKAFVKLVENFPKVNFILKLHPSEDHTYYFDILNTKLKKYSDRVKIIVQEYIWDVLAVTDIELKRSCTTGIESWILNKPTIELRLYEQEYYYSKEHASGSDEVFSYEQLEELIRAYLNGKRISNEQIVNREKFLKKWCFNIDGNSTCRTAMAIDEIISIQKNKIIPFSLKKFIMYLLLKYLDYLPHDFKLYGIKGLLQRRFVDNLGRIDKHFHNQDIKRWERKIADLINNKKDLRCLKI
ncbi:surface carbohydrate biosynthesis protein [Caminibacter pacificus]